jgi:hypothetical protein
MQLTTTLDDLHYVVGEINGKLDLLIKQGKVQDDRHETLDERVRILEIKQYWYAGAASIIGAAMGFIARTIVVDWKWH